MKRNRIVAKFVEEFIIELENLCSIIVLVSNLLILYEKILIKGENNDHST